MIQNAKNPLILLATDHATRMESLLEAFKGKTSFNVFCLSAMDQVLTHLESEQPDVCVLGFTKCSSMILELIAQVRAQSYVGLVILLPANQQAFTAEALAQGADIILENGSRFPLISAAVERLYVRVSQINALQALIDQASPKWALNQTSWCLMTPDSGVIKLSEIELKVLVKLVKHHGQPISRFELACLLGRERCDNYEGYINTLISRLRRKVRQYSEFELGVKSCRGAGYMMSTEVVLK